VNPFYLLKLGAGVIVVIGAYFFGLSQGHDSEQLKSAQKQVRELTETIQRYETKQKEQTIALAELRVSESAARADSDRMRDRIHDLEKRAKTATARDTVRCLQLGAECRELLQQARGALNYCRKALQ
jgi:methylthioribose-1-phosphate isomerase